MDGAEGEIFEEASWVDFLVALTTVKANVVIVAIVFPGKLQG